MAEFASRGVANTALGLSIGSVAAELLGGTVGNILGGGPGYNGCGGPGVSRRESELLMENAELKSEVKFRDANTYTMGEMSKLRDYVDRRFGVVEAQLGTQSVLNAQVTANLSCMQNNIATLMGLTKTVIPTSSVCPEPMPLYNSWTAPTTTT